MRFRVRSLASLSGLRIWRCSELCGIGRSLGLDLMLLWLWCRPAAIAPIEPLAWEPPYAAGAALKSRKKKKKAISHPENLKNLKPGEAGVIRYISSVKATQRAENLP